MTTRLPFFTMIVKGTKRFSHLIVKRGTTYLFVLMKGKDFTPERETFLPKVFFVSRKGCIRIFPGFLQPFSFRDTVSFPGFYSLFLFGIQPLYRNPLQSPYLSRVSTAFFFSGYSLFTDTKGTFFYNEPREAGLQ